MLGNKAVVFALALAMTTLPAVAADNPLLGKWQIVEVIVAPWASKLQRPQTAESKRLLNMQITFTAKAMTSGYPTLNCNDAKFEVTSDPADVLFRGSLLEPNQESVAARLGLPRNDVPTVEINCSSGDFPFHFRDKDTALFALNDMIYTIKRR
jgi:hypothetical protein